MAPEARTLDGQHNNTPLTAAVDWIDADGKKSDTVDIDTGHPRAIVCLADGSITMTSVNDNVMTLTATASPTPLPYTPKRIDATGYTGTWYLLY